MKCSLLLYVLLFPQLVLADCDPKDEGDCCRKDADCIAYVYETLCSVIPLNRLAAEEMSKSQPPSMVSCSAEKIAQLKKDAQTRKVRCEESSCSWTEDSE